MGVEVRTGTRAWRGVGLLIAVACLTLAAMVPLAAEEERPHLDVAVFAEVPDPGHPEGMAVAPDGTVYVGTHQHVLDPPTGPSRVFAYSSDGELLRSYTIEGQDRTRGSGVLGMALDADGVLYIVDRYPQRVIALDTDTGEQWDYATFDQRRTLCIQAPALVLISQCAYADDLAFAEDGTMYVTDVAQNLIWRVPPGGGHAEEWFTDTRIASPAGPNGIEVMADGETLMFAQTITGPLETLETLLGGELAVPATSMLYTLAVQEDGSPGELEVFWEAGPADGIDGFALAASGNVYAAVALSDAVAVISPDGQEIARVPADPVQNLLLDVPLDSPGSVKFLGQSILVSNHAPFAPLPGSFVIFDIHVGETGLPKWKPVIPRPSGGESATVPDCEFGWLGICLQ